VSVAPSAGCYAWAEGGSTLAVFFNPHATGAGDASSRLVCNAGTITTAAPTPTAAPTTIAQGIVAQGK
jgi:hypothetical protein